MKELIAQYIASKSLAWSPSTLKTEASRLAALSDALTGNPSTLWAHLSKHKPYTRVTVWARVVAFYDWLQSQGHTQNNPYKQFRIENALQFKNAYVKERLDETYESARRKIEAIRDSATRRRALEILGGAVRWCESAQPQGSGYVRGKGGKVRPDFRPSVQGPDYTKSYHAFWRTLKRETGLKPHTLRKLALTRAAERGAKEADLMELAGWASFSTASSYLQPRREAELKQLISMEDTEHEVKSNGS